MVYELQRNDGTQKRLHVRIDYPKAGFVKVFVEDDGGARTEIPCEVVYPDKPHSQYLKGEKCGECRWVPVENVLEFTITENCKVFTEGDESIYGMVEIKWSFDEFFAAGGNTKFEDRLASTLGVHASRVKIVGVLEGSSIVHFFITKNEELENDPERSQFEMRELNDMIMSLFQSGELEKALEMPILRVENYYNDAAGTTTESPKMQPPHETNIKYPVLGLLIFSVLVLVVGIIIGFVLIRKRTKYEQVSVTQTENAVDITNIEEKNLDPSILDDDKFALDVDSHKH